MPITARSLPLPHGSTLSPRDKGLFQNNPLIKTEKKFGCCLFSKRRRLLKLFEKSFTKNLYISMRYLKYSAAIEKNLQKRGKNAPPRHLTYRKTLMRMSCILMCRDDRTGWEAPRQWNLSDQLLHPLPHRSIGLRKNAGMDSIFPSRAATTGKPCRTCHFRRLAPARPEGRPRGALPLLSCSCSAVRRSTR